MTARQTSPYPARDFPNGSKRARNKATAGAAWRPQPEKLAALGRWLIEQKYEFVPVTPATHARVLPRISLARSLRDIFGWNACFSSHQFAEVAARLKDCDALEVHGEMCRSRVRFAHFAKELFAHSSYPTLAEGSVFFGPDTLRFLRALRSLAPPYGRLIDVGTGSGAAGIWLSPHCRETLLADISADALTFTRANMAINGAGSHVFAVESDVLKGVDGPLDTVIANPPFLADPLQRKYRDGGGTLGTGLAVRIAEEALERLGPGGRLLMYSGAPISGGVDLLKQRLSALNRARVALWRYDEIDPDIFGEELTEPGYEEVERIAAVVLQVRVA